MSGKKKSKWVGFFLGMVVYALVVLIAASLGLKLLWDYADNYERALPAKKMAAYVSTLNETHVKKIAFDFVASLDKSIQSDTDSFAEIWKCFVGGVQYELIATDSEQGTATPEHWVVYCGERRLGVQYIINPRVEYGFLSSFYGKSFPMPYLAEYEISNYIGDPKIRFFDADGVEQARFTFTDGKAQMKRGSGVILNDITKFTENFIPYYVNCLSNVSHNASMNYYLIQPYVVPGSELDERLKAAIGGQVFAQSRGTRTSDVRIHEVFNLENEYYIVDLSYSVVTYTDKGSTSVDTDMYLVLYRDEEIFRAQMVELY